MKIKRTIDGHEYEFELTFAEMQKFREEEDIQWGKNIVENHIDEIEDTSVCDDEMLMLQLAHEVDDWILGNNGDVERNALVKFGIIKSEEDSDKNSEE